MQADGRGETDSSSQDEKGESEQHQDGFEGPAELWAEPPRAPMPGCRGDGGGTCGMVRLDGGLAWGLGSLGVG